MTLKHLDNDGTETGRYVDGDDLYIQLTHENGDTETIRVVGGAKAPEVKEQKLPPMKEMAGNLLRASFQHVRGGLKLATKEDSDRRWGICLSCEKLIDEKRCANCGCFMETKSTWAEQKCPEGKW